MGRGIALAFAYAGHEIALVDLKQRPSRRLGSGCAAKRRDEIGAEPCRCSPQLGAMPTQAVASDRWRAFALCRSARAARGR